MIHFINGLEPGMAFALGSLVSGAVVIAIFSAALVWDHAGRKLDDLVHPEPTPPTIPTQRASSNRKAGRTGGAR